MITLPTPAGPVQFHPRDLATMPRNGTPPSINETILRGFTVHWPGGFIGGTYKGLSTFEQLYIADILAVRKTIAEHNARDADGDGILDVSDVGYNYLVGRSGVVFEGRGWTRCGANGTLPTAKLSQYPPGTTSSNAYYVSAQIITGLDVDFKEPTPLQWEATKRLYTYIVDRAGIAVPHVNGHRDVRATACPGDLMHGRLSEIQAVWPIPAPPEPQPPSPDMEIDMLALDWNPTLPGQPPNPKWTAFAYTGVQLSHIFDGHADDVLRRAGVKRITVNDDELLGIIKSSETLTACPPVLSDAMKLAWE